MSICVVFAVRNEERNIEQAIRSVLWANEIYVVDSNSSDATVKVAESLGATVVQFQYDGGWPKKRNWALRTLPITSDWVLILDGDERVDPELQSEIQAAITRNDVNGFYLRWKFIFLGNWMKHCWSHGWMLRLFRRGMAEYEDLGLRGEGGWDAEVHENVVLKEGRAGKLSTPLLHDTNQDLAFWIRKQNEFSTWNAVRRLQLLKEPIPELRSLFSGDPRLVRKWMKAIFVRLPFRSFAMFLWLYFIKLGILDGRAGYYFCWLRAIHEFNISAKVFEANSRLSEQPSP